MNRKEYNSDPRYAKVLEQMDLLGIMDITTTRQAKNGTVTWKLPIKNNWRNGTNIEVGSFKSGMVRNNNSAHSNYQLNKCKSVDRYFKHYEYNDDYSESKWSGRYNKYACKERILIPIEIDRLEYLISYCLKNYYIKRANEVANGDLIPKWKLEHAVSLNNYENKHNEAYNNGYAHGLEQGKDKCCEEVADFRHESNAKIRNLENKLDTIKRIADYE